MCFIMEPVHLEKSTTPPVAASLLAPTLKSILRLGVKHCLLSLPVGGVFRDRRRKRRRRRSSCESRHATSRRQGKRKTSFKCSYPPAGAAAGHQTGAARLAAAEISWFARRGAIAVVVPGLTEGG